MTPLPRLRQPDTTTCGASCLVVADLLGDPTYGGILTAPDAQRAFSERVLVLHPRVRRVWPRWLGTTPWAIARGLRRATGSAHSVRWVRGRRARRRAWPTLLEHVAAGRPVAVFVGSRTLPRHVVLAHCTDGDRVGAYEPGFGLTIPATREQLLAGRLPWGFGVPWAVVLPRTGQRGGSLSPGDSDLPG